MKKRLGYPSYFAGGTIPSQKVEVEDNEVAETPSGQLMQFNGPSHEQGGIPAQLPAGTNVFSNRLSLDGKTMQERKKARENKESRLIKSLKRNPADVITKNTLARVKKQNASQEMTDLIMQQAAAMVMPEPVAEKGMPKAAYGMPPTTGNIVGIAGTVLSSVLPLLTTMKNQKAAVPNVNTFKNFGQQAIDTVSSTEPLLADQRNNQMRNLQTIRSGAYARNRNSVRSLNTLHALNTATDASVSAQENNIDSSYSNSLMQLRGQKAALQNSADFYQMTGEQQKNTENKMDVDSYYTNINQDLNNIGTGVQRIGGVLNQQKANSDFLALLPELSKWGLGIEYVNGRPQLVNAKK